LIRVLPPPRRLCFDGNFACKITTDGIVMKILLENESLDSELSIKFCKSFGSALVKVCTLRVFSSVNLFNRFLTLSLDICWMRERTEGEEVEVKSSWWKKKGKWEQKKEMTSYCEYAMSFSYSFNAYRTILLSLYFCPKLTRYRSVWHTALTLAYIALITRVFNEKKT